MGISEQIYKVLPLWAQHFAVSGYGYYWKNLRFGKGYQHFLKQYREREKFTDAQWQEWQRRCLVELLKVAAKHVPYYRDHWTETQKKAALDGKLRELPFLEKEFLRKDPRAFLNQAFKPEKELLFHTSGSTGTPIKSYWSISELRQSLALREARSANWAGVSFKMPRATFSGRLVEPNPYSRGPYYRWNQAERQVYFSAFHLKPETAAQYIEALKKHQIQWGTGYAQSFYLLAKYATLKRIKVPALKAIVTTSEKLTSEMRIVMEDVYQCRVYEEYSTVENVVFASECEAGSLHLSPDVSVVEILNPKGEPCQAEEIGEVVSTCLSHNHQIFIRYRLGDMAAWSEKKCSCKRSMPVLKEVTGRVEDVVSGPDGRQMVRFHGIFIGLKNILEGQIIQEAPHKFQVKVAVENNVEAIDEVAIRTRMLERLGNVEIHIEKVTAISRDKSGKFRAVISQSSRK